MEQKNHKSVPCPCCGNKRITDIFRNREIFTAEESKFPPDMEPDLFIKCKVCKKQIGLKFM